MAKQILFKEDAHKALKRGIDTVANAVKITIGPRGRNVVFDRGFGAPTITNDGVSIAKEITLKDKFENMGAEIVKEVANKTNDAAGDGTTTSVVLTQAIVSEGIKKVAMGANPLQLRRGIEDAAKDAVEALKDMAKPIKSSSEVKQVATISAENEEVGGIIAETIERVGKDGVVTVEESQSFGVDSEVVEGLSFDKGYVSPYMITNTERMEAEMKNPYILVTDQKISAVKDVLPLLEKVAQMGKKELVIIAEDIDGEALTTFVVNKLRGTFSVLGIKAPGFGDRKKELLADIATTVGAKVVSPDFAVTLENADPKMLGSARRIIAKKDSTIVVDGKGKKSEIAARIKEIKAERDAANSKYDKERLDERIAKLSGGVAVIKVGAPTEAEMKYLKLKVEDAVNATKAAIEEGVVAGGGTALLKVGHELLGKMTKNKKMTNGEYEAGYNSVVAALAQPLKQILENCGKEDGAVVIEKVLEAGASAGYDALNDEVKDDMFKAGIIDPVKVTRTALQNAASASGIILTTDVAIAEEPEKDKGAMPPMSPEMGY